MARREPAGIRLLTWNAHESTDRYPAVVAAMNHLPVRSCLIDGDADFLDDVPAPVEVVFVLFVHGQPTCGAGHWFRSLSTPLWPSGPFTTTASTSPLRIPSSASSASRSRARRSFSSDWSLARSNSSRGAPDASVTGLIRRGWSGPQAEAYEHSDYRPSPRPVVSVPSVPRARRGST
jgi:hypothetical protein